MLFPHIALLSHILRAMSNIEALHDKVDAFFGRVRDQYGAHLSCQAGCSACCDRTLSLFPVELVPIRATVLELPTEVRQRLRQRAASEGPGCPLLEEGQCLVYEARPVICRSHGAPVQVVDGPDLEPRRDVCPLNFQGAVRLDQLDDEHVLDVERLNVLLSLVNRMAVGEGADVSERINLREALREWLGEAST